MRKDELKVGLIHYDSITPDFCAVKRIVWNKICFNWNISFRQKQKIPIGRNHCPGQTSARVQRLSEVRPGRCVLSYVE